MRFFLLSSLLVLGIMNLCLPVRLEIYASHCALDRNLLQVKGFHVRWADLPPTEEAEYPEDQATQDVYLDGIEALALPWIQKLNLIK